MPDRRKLLFDTFDQVIADIEQLRDKGYEKVGNWSLAGNCWHLRLLFDQAMDGFTTDLPLFLKPFKLFAPKLLEKSLRERSIPANQPTLKVWRPSDDLDDQTEANALIASIQRYQQHTEPLHPSPLFGKLDRETWDKLQLNHCAHHLSFLLPM